MNYSRREDIFHQKIDHAGAFFQLINNFKSSYILTEIIQNELDARSTETNIEFLEDRIISRGNGNKIDNNGWDRLTFLYGAGSEIPSKENAIGKKNYGLRTCFTISDKVIVRSNQLHSIIEIYRQEAKPKPEAFIKPLKDITAPSKGTVIEILYRKEDLKVIAGENFNFLAPDNNKKDFLFDEACKSIPKNFIGVLRPIILPKYSITLNHWQKGSTTFLFECKKTNRNFNTDIFTRTCTKISGNKKIVIIKEEFFEFYLNLSDLNKYELPWALSRNKKAIADIAWEIDGKKNLINSVNGIRRYPIAFFNNKSSEVLTDLGIHFTGPYVPLSERDVPSDQVINSYIDDACKKKFYSIFKKYLFPKYSSSCLNLCISNSDKDNLNYEKLSPLILNLVNKGMIPVSKFGKGISTKLTLNNPRLKPYSFIIPTYRWAKGEFSTDLSKIAPNEFFQIHKSIPKEILSILSKIIFDKNIKTKTFMTFDEIDALDRMTDTKNIFPWKTKKEQLNNLSNLSILKLYFGNINKILQRKNIHIYLEKKFKEVRQNILLPDSNNELYKIKLLNQSQIKINGIPGFNQKILNYKISNHSVVKKLKIKKFDINNYLQQLTLKNFTSKKIFNNFFNWLDTNHNDFTKKSLSHLFQLDIWPTSSGQFVSFDKICLVKNKKSLKLLDSIIVSPNKDLISFSQKNKWIKLRKNLNNKECVNYFTSNFDKILVEHNSDISKLKHPILNFEKNLEYLIKDKNLNFKISENIDSLNFFNREGESKFIKDLYLLNKNDYNIPKKYLIFSSNKIFKKFGVGTKLSANAMHDTIINHQTDNIKILSKRINYLNEFNDNYISDLSEENIIPFNEEYYSPDSFKIKGIIDYWGKWKFDHPDINALSALERENFVKAGVYRQYSSPEQTISFFNWLQQQPSKTISDHINQIINHWKKDKEWSNIPALPVQNHKGKLNLVTLEEAADEKNKILISDFIQLENEMKKKQTSFRFIYFVHQNRKIIDINFLKKKNINLLNSIARIEKIHNKSVLQDFDLQNMLLDKLKHFQSTKIIKQLSQRLIEKDFPGRLNYTWKSKISKIKKIIITEKLEIIYFVKREQYAIKKDYFLDKDNIIYINYQSNDNYDHAFYQLIAENIFFDHKRYFGAALKDAVEMDFKPRKSLRSKISNADEEDYPKGEEDNNLVGKPTPMIPQHPGRKLKQQGPSDNQRPKPKEKKSKNKGKKKIPNRGNKTKSSSPEQEKKDIIWLKKDQYAYHCQVCLGSSNPKNLAPKGTYSYEQIHRQEFMMHHHVTFKGPEAGQREAGNILILCYNHHNGLKPISDKITRKLILTKFKKNDFAEVTRIFSETGKDQIKKGKVISIDLVTGEKVKLFFREEHLRLFINLKD